MQMSGETQNIEAAVPAHVGYGWDSSANRDNPARRGDTTVDWFRQKGGQVREHNCKRVGHKGIVRRSIVQYGVNLEYTSLAY